MAMFQPVEMRSTLPMTLHSGVVSTTTKVWEMLTASREGELDRVQQMIAEQPQLSTCQYNYTPPLHLAIREGHFPVIRTLVAVRALDPAYKSYPYGDTFLTVAEDRGHDEIAAFLRESLADPRLTMKWRETGHIDYQPDETQKRFEKAVHDDHLEEAASLLRNRPELARNEMSSWAEGVLMMPSRGANRPMLELLIRFGAQVPEVSKWGRFYYFKHDDIATYLIEKGMSARHMNWHRVTLLHEMAQSGEFVKARLLIDHGADIDAIDDEYRTTPLGMAARWGQKDMVAMLLEKGADPTLAGATWATPMAWAQKKGHWEIASLLKAAGANS